jgi:hypothetical protein
MEQGLEVRGQGSEGECQSLAVGVHAAHSDSNHPCIQDPFHRVRILAELALFAALWMFCGSSTSFAQKAPSPQIVGIRVGFGDYYKVGLWTPVEIALRGGSKSLPVEVSAIVPDGDGVPSRVSTPPDQPCALRPDGETTVRLLCRFGRVRSELTVELRAEGASVVKRTFQTASQADGQHFLPGLEFRDLIVTIGPLALGVAETGKLGGAEVEHQSATARLDNLEHLPTDWRGYEGVDALILSTSRPEIYSGLTKDDARIRALDEWVRMGGRLVLCAGSHAEQVLGADGPLARFCPGRLERMVSLRQTGALESYCGSRTSVPQVGNVRTALRVPRLSGVRGIVDAQEADLPLVVRSALGFGQVIFVAADLDAPPLSAWTARPMLVAKLLDMPTGGGEESERGTALAHFGYTDISGQLRSALDRFSGVRSTPFWLVAGLIVAYLLLIGPGDYFLLRKVVGRMEWTWLSFSAIVLLACLGAYVLAYRMKGDAIRVHQSDLVEVDAASGRLRGTTWLNVFSPRTEAFNLSLQPRALDGGSLVDNRAWIAWLGLPGGGLGGMNPRTADPAMWREPYDFSPSLDALHGVPIQVWSTKSLTAQWTATTAAFPRASLTDDNRLLTGAVTNTLGFPLEDCLLAYGRFVYEVGTIGPGGSAEVGPMTRRSELKTLLTGWKVVAGKVGDKYRQETTPYDQSSADVPYILRMMMFYEAAGGRRYTGLWNTYQDFVDVSTLLMTDRAILMTQQPSGGKDSLGGATLLRDGKPLAGTQDEHITMYRFVFPVKKEKL